jgi:hypothetical protein
LGKKYLSWKIIGKTEQKKRQKSSKRKKKKSEKIIWSFCFSPFPFLSLFVSVWFPSTQNQVLCGKKAERERERVCALNKTNTLSLKLLFDVLFIFMLAKDFSFSSFFLFLALFIYTKIRLDR